jgi:hypothetical protein
MKNKRKVASREEVHPIASLLTQSICGTSPETNFGGDDADGPPVIDAVIAAQLNQALRGISPYLFLACFERGLLPRNMENELHMALFLSEVLPAARSAQSQIGVPASILVSDAYQISGPRYDDDGSHDIFQAGGSYKSLTTAFCERASWLAKHPKFANAMKASSPEEFLRELKRCTVWRGNDLRDRIDNIVTHGLQECDRLKLKEIR